ncbi:MAG TPA: hydroxymethylbilane synthase [Clostridiaceae bacterium]|nr:hydroxymethylbilane synthase [Clostridiaceae bacterium]
MSRVIRVGSRESKLAMVQTLWVVNEIKKKHPELEFEIKGYTTKGDILLNDRLDKVGGKGLFIKELEHALINGEIDFAVHSLKDMPAQLPEELDIVAVSKREDPRDVLVTVDGRKLRDLPDGAVIGTSSVRREVQISCIRPGMVYKILRGNVLTRLKKLKDGEYDAIVLAAAGLKRLGITDCDYCFEYFDTNEVLPAVGQGILAIEARKCDALDYLMDSVHDSDSFYAALAERAFMIGLNGGCTVPMGAYAAIEGDIMRIKGMLALEDRSRVFKAETEGSKYDAENLGRMLAGMILKQFH